MENRLSFALDGDNGENRLQRFVRDNKWDEISRYDWLDDESIINPYFGSLSADQTTKIGDYLKPFRPLLARLREYQYVDGIYVDPKYSNEQFKTLNEWDTIRAFRTGVGYGAIMLYLEALHSAETGELNTALENLFTLGRLGEHYLATWNPYFQIDFAGNHMVMTFEALLNRKLLDQDTLNRILYWTRLMESRLDYRNPFAGLQILAQQTNVLADERFSRYDDRNPLTSNSSFGQEISYFLKGPHIETAQADSVIDLNY